MSEDVNTGSRDAAETTSGSLEDVSVSSRSGVEETTAQMSAARCHLCSEPARVRVLDGYSNGRPLLRELCLSCVSSSPRHSAGWVNGKQRMGLATLVGMAGLALGLIGGLADVLIPDANTGFGLYQQGGVVLGALLVLTGALIRVDVIVLGGAFIFVAALTADWFGATRSQGIGWKQQTVIVASLVLLVCGVVGRYRWSLINAWRRLTGRTIRAVPSRTGLGEDGDGDTRGDVAQAGTGR